MASSFVFPELSLTGYEMAMARELAIRPDDHSLIPLREQARRSGMTAVVGAPLRSADDDSVFIAARCFGPTALLASTPSSISMLAKRLPSPLVTVVSPDGRGRLGRARCLCGFSSRRMPPVLRSRTQTCMPWVLSSRQSRIRRRARDCGATPDHEMAVLLANHGAMTGGWACAGRSAIWAAAVS